MNSVSFTNGPDNNSFPDFQAVRFQNNPQRYSFERLLESQESDVLKILSKTKWYISFFIQVCFIFSISFIEIPASVWTNSPQALTISLWFQWFNLTTDLPFVSLPLVSYYNAVSE